MSDSSEFFRSGGRERVLRVTTSGTFTPSAAHLAKGGVATVTASGGAGSGALNRAVTGTTHTRLGGGNAGERVRRTVALAGPVSYTIGAGGSARSATGTTTATLAGNDGGDTVITGLFTAKGGKGGATIGTVSVFRGGDGAGGLGAMSASTSGSNDARGGVGVDGTNGGGGGTVADTNTPYGITARDGGGDGICQSNATVGTVLPGNNGLPGSGAGGGAISVIAASSENLTVTSGAGAGGWIEFRWVE